MNMLVRLLWVGCGVGVSTSGLAAEWSSVFTVPVSVGYTDNANLAAGDKKQDESFWRIAPGFGLSAKAPHWNASVGYAYSLEQRSGDASRHDNQHLSAQFDSEVASNLLFLDANATISQQRENVLDAAGFSGQNLRDVYSWTVRPALRHQFANASRAEVAVAEYGVSSSGSNHAGDGMGERVNAGISSGGMLDALRLDLSGNDDRFRYDQPVAAAAANETHSQSAALSATLTVSPRVTPYASYGYERYYDTVASARPSQTYWRAGTMWAPSARTNLDANYGKRFSGETWAFNFRHNMRRFNWSLAYVQDVRTGRQDFVNPESLAIFNSLNDNTSLKAAVPDAAARAALVGLLMQSQGLAPITVLADRRYLDRSLTSNLAYSTAKSNSSLTVYWRDSDANKVSLPWGGGNPAGAGEHVRQKGAGLNWGYRLGVNTSLSAGLGGNIEQEPASGVENRNTYGRLGLSYVLGRHVSGTAEFRRNDRRADDSSRDYTENSILLSLVGTF